MTYNSQLGLVYYRDPNNVFLPFYNNPNSRTWSRRMLANGGNRFGIQGKLGNRIQSRKISRLLFI